MNDCDLLPEGGYTPTNLRALMAARGWTFRYVAEYLGVSVVTAQRWAASPDLPSYREMSLATWQKIYNHAKEIA